MSDATAVDAARAARTRAARLQRARVTLETRHKMREDAHPGNPGLQAQAKAEAAAADREVARADGVAIALEITAGIRPPVSHSNPTPGAPPAGNAPPVPAAPPAGDVPPVPDAPPAAAPNNPPPPGFPPGHPRYGTG